MKNFEKYKSHESRSKAFNEWCATKSKNGSDCAECPLFWVRRTLNLCSMAWLDLEYEKHIPTSDELIRRMCFSGFSVGTVCSKTIKEILEQRDLIKEIWARQDEEQVREAFND